MPGILINRNRSPHVKHENSFKQIPLHSRMMNSSNIYPGGNTSISTTLPKQTLSCISSHRSSIISFNESICQQRNSFSFRQPSKSAHGFWESRTKSHNTHNQPVQWHSHWFFSLSNQDEILNETLATAVAILIAIRVIHCTDFIRWVGRSIGAVHPTYDLVARICALFADGWLLFYLSCMRSPLWQADWRRMSFRCETLERILQFCFGVTKV